MLSKFEPATLAKIAALSGVVALTLGSTGGQAASASEFVAKAPTLDPRPVEVQPIAPIVQTEVVQEEAQEASEPATVQSSSSTRVVRSSGGGDLLSRIRACESGGNYGAVSGSGKYRGAYQFDYRTWASVGGSGDPAAASAAEQDARAAALMAQRGGNPWPVCSRR